jgi:hypothetical protein
MFGVSNIVPFIIFKDSVDTICQTMMCQINLAQVILAQVGIVSFSSCLVFA